jgi:hypothetical protein
MSAAVNNTQVLICCEMCQAKYPAVPVTRSLTAISSRYVAGSHTIRMMCGEGHVTQSNTDACSVRRKINYTEIGKQNKKIVKCWKCNLVKNSCVTQTVHQTRYCRFVWHRRNGNCTAGLILTS